MRWRRLIWLLVSGIVVTVTWKRGQNAVPFGLLPGRELKSQRAVAAVLTPTPVPSSTPQLAPSPVAPARLTFRLSNTSKPLAELLRSERAILLENAFLDTATPVALAIPDEFRRKGEPGSYIVQARGVLDAAFRESIESAGAKVVSYIPNNAYLIRASESAAQSLSANPQTQVVLPYEPYYKLKLSLLETAGSTSASTVLALNVLLFADSPPATWELLGSYGAEILSEESSPFGPLVRIRVAREHLGSLAAIPEVAALELSHQRVTANDLSRVTIGVAPDSVTPVNYLGLTGTNVMVNVNDTGVDATQPELSGRVLFDKPNTGTDTNGHGTHVAGIIGSSGAKSTTVTNAPGSRLPPVNYQFRGLAPETMLFAIATGLQPGPEQSDAYLQQTAAQTESFISNNSWDYAADNEYDFAAASYDAAVRDALPGLPGSQPLLYVFAAGNVGQGEDDGTGGIADTIQSPATGKNVITVGALEQPRFITNQTWTCGIGTGGAGCITNTPWLGLTDSSNEVAAFSSRGNVGIGIEGNSGRLKPDLVAPGTFILSTRSTQWDEAAYYSQTNTFLDHSPDTNYSPVLSNLNRSAGPYYRFESGTSLAAAEVSGTLALMQEFFEQRLGRTNSPALMKALLINGSRSLGANYGTFPAGTTNLQGWGLIHLPNSLPGSLSNLSASANSTLLFDQSPGDSLATGQSHTRYFSLSAAATNLPLRVTLVWTDPPGNPVAAVKLVNDLDLVVTNLDTGEVFWGNDIPPGSDFNRPWNPSGSLNTDRINNVENVFLAPLGGSHYSITVLGRRVNVNAVSAQTRGVVQDYALVVSSGNGEIVDALTVTDSPIASTSWSAITFLTNTFNTTAGDAGALVLKERIGAGSALLDTNTVPLGGNPSTVLTLGIANQWRFYVCSNDTGFTNAAFLTFLTPSITTTPEATSPPRTNGARLEADIDLYISTNPGLTNLDPQVIALADASLNRGGEEMIIYSNATPGPYYIGVKCESGEGAEYGLLTAFSQEPFFQNDGLGNDLLRGFPAPAAIPSGTPSLPGSAYLFCVNVDGSLVRRVVATNTLTAPVMSDLVGTLAHNHAIATLNNHSTNGPVTSQTFLYDDSGQGDILGSQSTDGPGSLHAFAGHPGFGQWLLTMASTNQAGSDYNFGLFIENQPDLTAGISVNLLPGACRQDFLFVPAGVSNITALANLASGGSLSWRLYPAETSGSNCPSLFLPSAPTNASIVIDATSEPPINPGLYVSTLCNAGPATASVNLSASYTLAPAPPNLFRITSPGPMPIADDAISSSTVSVTNTEEVLSTEVGIRIDHPRISDLAISLISPQGTRVLLDENRGGASSQGMGANAIVTNITPVSSTGGPQASTNVLDTGQTSGTVAINYDFFALPDEMRIYYEGQLLYDSGLVSFTGATNINYGPGDSTLVTIIMNEGGNFDTNTAWFYTVTSTHPVPIYFTFTENTNLTTVPIKFAPEPFTNLTYTVPGTVSSNAIYYLPEESLDRLVGQPALGQWTLEIRDTRAGPNSAPPRLVSWQLSFLLENDVPTPVLLVHDQPSTNLLGPGQIQWFSISPPSWLSFVTNALLSASLPVNVWFNANTPPTGTNNGDVPLLLGSGGGSYTLQTNAVPPLLPGSSYFLGIQNTNAATVEFVFEVTFDVTNVVTLQSGMPYAAVNPGPMNAMDYYRYVVTTNAVRAQFEINGPSTNMLLLARKGRLPALGSYNYISANPGTNDQLIVIYNYSSPVALTAGEWFLAAVNGSSGAASYSILATEFSDYGTNLVVMNPVPGATSLCLSWNSLPGMHYYVQAKTNLTDAQWTTVSPTLTAVDVFTTFCIPLPLPFQFFRVGEGLVVTKPLAFISRIEQSAVKLPGRAAR